MTPGPGQALSTPGRNSSTLNAFFTVSGFRTKITSHRCDSAPNPRGAPSTTSFSWALVSRHHLQLYSESSAQARLDPGRELIAPPRSPEEHVSALDVGHDVP